MFLPGKQRNFVSSIEEIRLLPFLQTGCVKSVTGLPKQKDHSNRKVPRTNYTHSGQAATVQVTSIVAQVSEYSFCRVGS